MKKWAFIGVALLVVLVLFVRWRLTTGWQESWENLIGGDNSLVVLVVDDAGMPIKDVVLRFYGNAYVPKYPIPFSSQIMKRKDFEIKTDKAGMAWVRWPRMTLGLHHAFVAGKEVEILNMGDNCWAETWGGYATSSFAILRHSPGAGITIMKPERNFKGDRPFKI